jgi:glycosyltransferase involved in cell wall biosynthesis
MPDGLQGTCSVVIPSKDGSNTIERALDSVFANGDVVTEVFVVFSNSPERYKSFLHQLLAKKGWSSKVTVLDTGSGNGSAARNMGIDHAKGEYVALLDDDDEWARDKIKQQIDLLSANRDNAKAVCFCPALVVRDGSLARAVFPPTQYRQDEPFLNFLFSPLGGAQTSTLILKTGFAREVRFDPQLKRHQDYDFCMRLVEKGAVFIQHWQALSHWHMTGGSNVKGGGVDFCFDWIRRNMHRLPDQAVAQYLWKEIYPMSKAEGVAISSFKRFFSSKDFKKYRLRSVFAAHQLISLRLINLKFRLSQRI